MSSDEPSPRGPDTTSTGVDDDALDAAIIELGVDVLLADPADVGATDEDEVLERFVGWLQGDRLTDRADEPERRLEAATDAQGRYAHPVYDRLLACSILELPAGHPRRDVARARLLLTGVLAEHRLADERGERIRTIATLLDEELVSEEAGERLLAEGEAIRDDEDDPYGAFVFRLGAKSFCIGRWRAWTDEEEPERAREWLERSAAYLGLEQDEFDLATAGLGDVAAMAEHLDVAGDHAAAADCWARIVDESGLEDQAVRHFAIREATLRLMIDDTARAAERGSAALPHVEAAYVRAVEPAEVEDAASELADLVAVLVQANAGLGRWDEAIRALDRSAGLRQRSGELADVPPEERAAGVASPGLAELATALGDDEAVLVVAHHFTGSVAFVVGPADRTRAAAAFRLADLDTRAWMLLFGEQGGLGLFAHIPGGSSAAGDAALGAVLDEIDRRIGFPVADVLHRLGLRRLTVVADRMLNLVPWAAVPSLRPYAVSLATSPSDVVESRRPLAPAARTAAVIGNPTLDLPVSETAAAALGARLHDGGYAVTSLLGPEATAARVREALTGATVVHVGGHGRGEVGYAALELAPGELLPAGGDPFPAWMAGVWQWTHEEVLAEDAEDADEDDEDEPGGWSERWAEVDGLGRLSERRYRGTEQIVRFADTPAGTLAASYAGGRLQRISALLSDDEIAAAGGEVRLAVLSACETGGGLGRAAEHELGVARAFRQAGVRTVIGSLWPVEEAVAVVFQDLLSGGLAEHDGRVDVAGLVRDARERLRRMRREEAAGRLLALSDAASHPVARLVLEAYADGLPDPPFAHYWQWATFTVVGCPDLLVEEPQP